MFTRLPFVAASNHSSVFEPEASKVTEPGPQRVAPVVVGEAGAGCATTLIEEAVVQPALDTVTE